MAALAFNIFDWIFTTKGGRCHNVGVAVSVPRLRLFSLQPAVPTEHTLAAGHDPGPGR